MPGWLSWLLLVLGILAIVVVGYGFYQIQVANPNVAEELVRNPQGPRAQKVMMLTFPDGKSIPVNYLRVGDQVYVGADGPWWRSFRGQGAPVTLMIKGETLTGQAVVVLEDPAYTKDVFSRLRPSVPKWLPDWLNGKLVVITLNEKA